MGLALEWAELDVVTAQIRYLQSRRYAAKSNLDAALAKIAAAELDHALGVRDELLARIMTYIGAAALSDPESCETV